MKRALAIILLLVIAVLTGVVWMARRDATQRGGELTVYCAAGLKKPVEQIAADFQRETGTAVRLQYGGTAALLSAIRLAQKGDLFIAADAAGVNDARKFDAIREVIPLVKQHAVIAVRAGNPRGVRSLTDLLRDDLRLALANAESAAIGRAVKTALGDRYPPLAARAVVQKPTVTEIAADLSLGAVDAAILWNSTVPQFSGIEAVEVPELSASVENASAAVLASSKQPALALRFARYLAAPEKGGAVFGKHGFSPLGGDRWAATPELILYSGGLNRPAIEQLLRDFADREGATMTTVFNGCGILCASMKAMTAATDPKFPDAYYACDLCFIPPVARHFPETVILTETEIGIVVKKGNPRGVRGLPDLAQAGLRIGLCNAQQSTLGFMTGGILTSSGIADAVRKNVVVEVPTADFLINQMRAGALDAAIVYRVNAMLQEAHLDFIPIDHPGARAQQPFSVRAESPRRQLADRLLVHLQANRGRFESAGFTWRGDQSAMRSDKIEVPAWLRAAPVPR